MRGSGLIVFIIASGILIIFFYYATMLYSYLFGRRGLSPAYRDFYECGFKMVPDTHQLLDLNYSLLGLIFLVYDMEIILLVPLLVNMGVLPVTYMLLAIVILIVLAISYWYEWECFAFEWVYL